MDFVNMPRDKIKGTDTEITTKAILKENPTSLVIKVRAHTKVLIVNHGKIWKKVFHKALNDADVCNSINGTREYKNNEM
jgi:spore coat polysaccharide biosynthesis protein SpsF (cytidylyltransferase family)